MSSPPEASPAPAAPAPAPTAPPPEPEPAPQPKPNKRGLDTLDPVPEPPAGPEDGAPSKPKAVRLSNSKIQGHADPRQPRVGAEYQAVLPDCRH